MPRLYITLALMLSGMGISAANIQMTLAHLGVRVHVDTITRILDHYSKIVEGYAKTIKPPGIQDTWSCDEKEQKIRGEARWIVALMDLTARFILAWDILDTKEKYDAAPLLRAAKERAGKIPRLFITDGLDQYHIAFKKVFYTLKGIISIHIRDIYLRNLFCNTNKQERLNGGFASRFRPARGINKEDSLIFRIAIIHHNYIKPHGGIEGRTPAEVAGIDIRGTDRWLTLIQTATSAA